MTDMLPMAHVYWCIVVCALWQGYKGAGDTPATDTQGCLRARDARGGLTDTHLRWSPSGRCRRTCPAAAPAHPTGSPPSCRSCRQGNSMVGLEQLLACSNNSGCVASTCVYRQTTTSALSWQSCRQGAGQGYSKIVSFTVAGQGNNKVVYFKRKMQQDDPPST